MIQVQGLTKLYGSLIAVDDLSFSVAPGEVLGLVGPNGAGKTTTLRSLVGIIKPTRGTIRPRACPNVCWTPPVSKQPRSAHHRQPCPPPQLRPRTRKLLLIQRPGLKMFADQPPAPITVT